MNQRNDYINVIGKSKKRQAQSSFIDNVWGADLADMQLISKYNKGIRFMCYYKCE